MPVKTRVIRDPLYGYISLPGPLAALVDHPLYQRLRRVGQTSLTSAVYPTATGTRFEHGLGAMHLAMRGFRAAWRNVRDEDTRQAFLGAVQATGMVPQRLASRPAKVVELLETAVGGCALLHDVGHPPFSHVLEPTYADLAPEHFSGDLDVLADWENSGKPYHEFAGLLIARQMLRAVRPDALANLIIAVLEADENASDWAGVLHAIVAGEVDIDRMDYVMRDAQKAGTEFGAIDYVRLIDALELHDSGPGFRIAPGVRARSAVETLLLQRTQAYKWITYHPRVVGANLALARSVESFRRLTESQDTFGVGDDRRPAGRVFEALWPSLNYTAPRESDLKRRLALIGGLPSAIADDDSQLSLGQQQEAALVDEFREDLQASVDDGVVVDALKTAGLVAEILLRTGTPDRHLQEELSRLLTYQQHALYRAKDCLPAWKTVDEFDAAAAEMSRDLIAALREAYDEVLNDSAVRATPEAAEAIEADRDDSMQLLAREPVIGANRLITALFDGETGYLSQFANALSADRPRLETAPGFWDLAYTGFTSIRQGDEAAVLFDGEEELRLFESSTLAQALARVEESRFRLCAFFFTNYPVGLPVSEDTDARELREKLTGDVISVFPTFVRRTLPNVIRDSFAVNQRQ